MTLSKSAVFYRTHKKSREAKKKYDTEYHKTPARRKYRSKLWIERRKRGIAGKGGDDLSHTKNGNLVRENRSRNRARQGANGKSTKK
jgi:hypothetical protein